MNPVRRDQNYRESWPVTNVTDKTLTISDLLSIPAFSPGQTFDILKYETREKISQSKILVKLIKKGWLTMIKKPVNEPSKIVDASIADKAISPIHRDDLVDGGGGTTVLVLNGSSRAFAFFIS